MTTRSPLRGVLGAAVTVVLLAVAAAPATAEPDVTVPAAAPTTSMPSPADAAPPQSPSTTQKDYGCWAAAMAGVTVGEDCNPASFPSTTPANQLADCFSTAVTGNEDACTIGLASPTQVVPEVSCRWESNGPGMGGQVVCPQQLAGLTDIPTDCGYLDAAWCASSAGTPREILMEELAGCELLAEDAPLSEVTSVAPGYLRDGQNLPATVNMRANCVRDTYAKLATLEAPRGWFNSASAPRTSAAFPVTTYHMFHKAEGKLGLQTLTSPFMGLFLTMVWQAGIVALRVAMWAFDWAVSGSVTAILAGIPGELARLLQTQVVRGLRLYEMGLALLGAAAGWKLLRGRVADAASTVVFALLGFTLGWFLLTPAAFSGYYAGALETRQLLADGLTFGVIADAGADLDAAAAMQVVLDSTVHTPWEHLNFGSALDDRCHIEAAQRLLIDGIRSQAATNLDVLRDCGAQGAAMADFAATATSERLFGAFMVVVGQIAVAGLVFVAAGLALLSEVLLGAAFASLPVAVAGVLWPGGRKVAGAWLSLLLRGMVGFGAGMLFLSLVMTVLAAVVGRTQGMALLERSLAFLLVAWAGWRLRKVFPKAAAQLSAQLGGKVSAAFSQQGVGGGGSFAGAAAGGLAGSFAAAHLAPRGIATAAKIGTKRLQGAAQKVTGLTAAAAGAAATQRPGLQTIANVAASTKGGKAAVEGRQAKGLAGTSSQAAAEGMARWLAGRGGRPPPRSGLARVRAVVKPPRVRKALAVTRRGVQALAGDPKALARIGVAAARRAPRVAAAAAALFAGGAVLVAAGFGTATGMPFGASDQVWTAYQLAASVICQRGGGAMLWPPEADTQPEGDRIDWRLIAALGEVSSAHAAGVSVNAFGDTLTQLVGQPDRADTDRGRFDGSATADARVGPLALWPAEVVTEGLDGNFDEIVDPHNVWDAAVTAAAALCVRGAADDPVGALLAWRPDRAWADRVLAAWDDITFQAAAATGPVPWGAPLAYTPRSAGGGGPVLAALVDRWVGAGTSVTCEGGICGVKLGFVPEGVAAWGGLLDVGYGAPVAVPNWGFTAAGDPSRHARILPWAAGLSWLFPSTPPPQPATYSPPGWWTFTLPPSSSAWTEPTDGHWLRIPAAAGTTVYAPTAGTAEYHAGGCVHIHDQDDARWELCGVLAHPGGTAPPPSGPLQRLLRDWPELERAARLTPPAVLVNLGTFSCRKVHDSETWSPHSWNNAVDLAVDVDGDLDREPHDMDSATSHDALSRLTAALARTMYNPRTSVLEDGSTLIQDQAPQRGEYQIRNLVFNLDYEPGTPVSVVRHDEHLHVDFWVGPKPDEPDCTPHAVTAGEGIGIAPGGVVTVAVWGPEDRRLCPQALFRAWQRGDPLTPAALETELLAEEEAAAEAAEAEASAAAAEPEEPEGCDE